MPFFSQTFSKSIAKMAMLKCSQPFKVINNKNNNQHLPLKRTQNMVALFPNLDHIEYKMQDFLAQTNNKDITCTHYYELNYYLYC